MWEGKIMKIERLEHILVKPTPPVEKIWENPQRKKTEEDIAKHHKKKRKEEIEEKKEEGIDITV
jgi:hypothetical protein